MAPQTAFANRFLLLRVTRKAALRGGFSQIRSVVLQLQGYAHSSLHIRLGFHGCSPFVLDLVVLLQYSPPVVSQSQALPAA